MPLKVSIKRPLKTSYISAVLYRVSMSVVSILVFPNGDSYPICPRCDNTLEREYMRFCDRCGQRLDWENYDLAEIVYVPRN